MQFSPSWVNAIAALAAQKTPRSLTAWPEEWRQSSGNFDVRFRTPARVSNYYGLC